MNETMLREALALAQELIDMMDWTGTGTSGEGQSERREYEARLAALARADDGLVTCPGCGREFVPYRDTRSGAHVKSTHRLGKEQG